MPSHALNLTSEVARVLHGMRQIREAAEAVSGHNVLSIPRDELLAGYWFLLQATLLIDQWPLHLQEGFREIRERFFAYGLPPVTVHQMSDHEVESVVGLIQDFRQRAEETVVGVPEAVPAVANAAREFERPRKMVRQWVPVLSGWSTETSEACA